MNFEEYFEKINAQKQIDTLAKKYKHKRVVVYGAGAMAKILFKNYNLKKLNIVAVCDNKFSEKKEDFFGFKTLSPEELKAFNYDIILVLVQKYSMIEKNLKYGLLLDSKNENVKIEKFIKIPLLMLLKEILF